MNLKELGNQYLQDCEILIKRIHELNKEVPLLKGNDIIVAKRRILSLYKDVAECRNIANQLINYYKGE